MANDTLARNGSFGALWWRSLKVSLLIIGVLAIVALAWYGSPGGAVTNMQNLFRGEQLFLESHLCDLGIIGAGQSCNATFTIVNDSERTVDVVGAGSGCACITTDDLPMAISSHSVSQISVRLRAPSSGDMRRDVVFYLQDSGAVWELSGQIVGQVAVDDHSAEKQSGFCCFFSKEGFGNA